MYKKHCPTGELPGLGLYLGDHLDPDYCWVKMAGWAPWAELGSDYRKHFKNRGCGKAALNVRVAMSLLIKGILGLRNRGVIEVVSGNPYLQYFLGFKNFQSTVRDQLESGNRLVTDAARLTGWNCSFYFCNSFKRYFGITPVAVIK
ncbi:hypothetical protein [Victivallis vadensis]|jgi:transposase IS4 family protein|uniref:hypothetical protein n=1 Tax=Victivallis vadensis TaxID=172901 RepID=UPI00266C0FCD|nr:hypothetical protein [Victivallis vadensis]